MMYCRRSLVHWNGFRIGEIALAGALELLLPVSPVVHMERWVGAFIPPGEEAADDRKEVEDDVEDELDDAEGGEDSVGDEKCW